MITITIEAETPAQLIDKLHATLIAMVPGLNVPLAVADPEQQLPVGVSGNGKVHTLKKTTTIAKPKSKPEPLEEPEPEPEITLDTLKQVVTEFLNAHEKVATLELLQKHGKSSNLSGIDKKLYPAVYKAARDGIDNAARS